MHIRSFERRELRKRGGIFFATFFFTLHYAAVLYVNSSFLGEFFSPEKVSFLFALGALANIALLFLAPTILNKIGNRKLFLLLIVLQLCASAVLALSLSPAFLAGAFVIFGAIPMLVYYSIDIFLEAVSEDKITGEIRGIVLTIANLAVSSAPLLVAFLAGSGNFRPLYLASAIFLLPVLFLALTSFKNFKDTRTKHAHIVLPFKTWWKRKDLRRTTLGRFTLEFFYVVMVIYTPIYLTQTIGFEWTEIGIIFTIMLLPFILFELPAGELADHWCGEKEIETIGFVIMGLSLLVMPFLGKSLILWSAILFLSRVGASFVEITNESYFFKQVDHKNAGLISIFRLTRSLALILGAYAGIIIISIFSYAGIFFFLSIIVFWGMAQTSHIKDTL
ncbi:MAG: MFS transporter [Parcubacteria group bacterium]